MPQPRPPTGPPPSPPPVDQPWRPRFNLFTLMLVMLIISVVGAGFYYVLRSMQSATDSGGVAILFILASPVLLVVLISAAWQIYRWAKGESDEES
jgi:hypothetical protein